jgi:allantoin racemase
VSHWLILNPNTTAAVTERLRAHAAALLGDAVTLHTATATFGARYITDEVSFTIAGHAALEAFTAHRQAHGEPDAVLMGCFGDPGVWALRELSQRPVIGLAEAAMRQAAARGRFAIVTGGAAWGPMLRRLALALGYANALASVHLVAPTGAELAADPAMARAVLGDACRQAAQDADVVILGGAGLAGMAAVLAGDVPALLIDSVTAGVQVLLADSDAFSGQPSTRLARPAQSTAAR